LPCGEQKHQNPGVKDWGLLTRIAATESVTFVRTDENLTAFLELAAQEQKAV
jgi:hypothetical protein